MPALESTILPTPTYPIFAAEAASSSVVPRQKLKTPMIAGSVCGGVMGLAWIIGFTIYFRKRCRRKMLKRKVAEGKAVQTTKPSKIPDERVIVPPDPAILLSHLSGVNSSRGSPNHKQGSGQSGQLANEERSQSIPYINFPAASEELLITEGK